MLYAKVSASRQYKSKPDSLYLWTNPYEPITIEKIKTLPLRRYHSDIYKWEVPLFSLQQVIKTFPNIILDGIEEVKMPEGFDSIDKYEEYLNKLSIEVDYQPKTKMDSHQVEWFNMMLTRDRVLNADPMGLGKTKEYLDVCEWRKISKGYRKCLFICGAKYKWNMARQIRIHTNSTYVVVEGTEKKRMDQLRSFFHSDDYYLIIGYESSGIHIEELKLLALNMGFDAVLIDECQKIKNYEVRKGVNGKKRHITVKIVDLVEYINPELLILGTGTPVSKKAEDLYSILRLCGVENKNVWSFKGRYCVFDSFGSINGYQNLPELKDKLDVIMIRRPKELLHLEKPIPEYMALRMEPKQNKFYLSCLLQLKSELKGTKAITSSMMTKILRLRQITSNPMLLDSDAPSIKEEILIDLVNSAAERNEKSVVFTIYVDEVNRLVEKFKDLKPAHIIGAMTSKKAQDEVDRFQDDPSCKVMVGSLMACKESYDMWAAKNVFFLDLSYNWSDNEQAVARVWRRGQKDIVNIYYLYCEGTIDEAVFSILIRDKKLADQLVGLEGESVRTFDRELIENLLIGPGDAQEYITGSLEELD